MIAGNMDGALNLSQARMKELALVLRPVAPEAGAWG